MTTLLLLRHGETDWNVERRYQGHSGPGLNERGRQQARDAADRLTAQPPAQAIVSSDLPRALETARIIGEALRLPVTSDPRLRERDLGLWTGCISAEVDAEFADLIEAWRLDPLGVGPPGGETGRQIARRMAAALDDLAAQSPGGRVVVVTHGGVLAVLRCMAESLPPTQLRFMRPGNAEIIMVEWPLRVSLSEWLEEDSDAD